MRHYRKVLCKLCLHCLTIVGTAIALFYLNVVLAVVTLIVVPLIVWVTKQIIKRSSVNFIARQRDLGALKWLY